MKNALALLLALVSPAAAAETADFIHEVDALRGPESEDPAIRGLVVLGPHASGSRAVGAIGRAYSQSAGPGNTAWGVVTEAVNLPTGRGNLVGLESAIANMAHDNRSELRGLDIVFKNRFDVDYDVPVPVVGENRFNENSAAVYVSAQPRSPAGEYSGWQAGVKFGPGALDRSVGRPYAAAIDVSDAQPRAPLYLIVWKCGAVRCGLAPTDDGARIVVDIEAAGN